MLQRDLLPPLQQKVSDAVSRLGDKDVIGMLLAGSWDSVPEVSAQFRLRLGPDLADAVATEELPGMLRLLTAMPDTVAAAQGDWADEPSGQLLMALRQKVLTTVSSMTCSDLADCFWCLAEAGLASLPLQHAVTELVAREAPRWRRKSYDPPLWQFLYAFARMQVQDCMVAQLSIPLESSYRWKQAYWSWGCDRRIAAMLQDGGLARILITKTFFEVAPLTPKVKRSQSWPRDPERRESIYSESWSWTGSEVSETCKQSPSPHGRQEVDMHMESASPSAWNDVYGLPAEHPGWEIASKLMIRNLPARCSHEELEKFVKASTGATFQLSMPLNQSGRNRGYAFIIVSDISSLRDLVSALWGKRVPSRNSMRPIMLQPGNWDQMRRRSLA
ncbi:unnamed protein product [Symbiodinium sp. CCMP2592]|nr:unnamed protein product [Symbiodinium sp. CCMP2592]